MVLDMCQAAFWTITYVLVIVYSLRRKTIAIPPIAIASNFAWETVALAQDIVRHADMREPGGLFI